MFTSLKFIITMHFGITMYVSFHSRLNTAKDVSLLCSSSVSLASAVAFLTGRGRLPFLLRQTKQISFCLRRSFILSKCSLCFPPHLVNSCRELPGRRRAIPLSRLLRPLGGQAKCRLHCLPAPSGPLPPKPHVIPCSSSYQQQHAWC